MTEHANDAAATSRVVPSQGVPSPAVLSPYSGWVRADWEGLADRMLAAVRPYAAPGHGLVHLPGPASRNGYRSDGLEGYARTFLLAAFRLGGAAATGGEAELARVPGDLLDRYASGLARGTDPDAPEAERWPRMSQCDQAKVEAASLALALHETRPWLWDRLDAGVRERAVDWFADMLGAWTPDNNWVWFRALVSVFLRSVGGPWRQDDIDRAVEATEGWHAGGGWYSDGADSPRPHRNFDHYSGWAMQLYPLWCCRITAAEGGVGGGVGGKDGGAPARSRLTDTTGLAALTETYRTRLADYLTDLAHLIGGDGAPLHQGRSLTYRWAAAAPFWSGALFGADSLSPGLTRRAASGMARSFVRRGALGDAGLLSLGWHGPYPTLRQAYSGPASPYWASKGFAGLLLPADHPVWTAVEEPLPVERGDFTRTLAAPGWTVSGTRADGIVRIANHGADHAVVATATPADAADAAVDPFGKDDPNYSRWAYSTVTAPELGGSGPLSRADGTVREPDPEGDLPGGGALDAHVALLDAADRPSHRRPLERLAPHASRHRAHWPQTGTVGPLLTTASALHGPWEVRAVRVDVDGPTDSSGSSGSSGGPGAGTSAPAGYRLRIGGWSVAGAEPVAAAFAAGRADATGADGLVSAVAPLLGAELRTGVRHATGRSAFGRHSAVPHAETAGAVRPGAVYAVALALSAAPGGPGPAPTATLLPPGVAVPTPLPGTDADGPSAAGDAGDATPDVLRIDWPDGTVGLLELPSAAAAAAPSAPAATEGPTAG